MASDPQSWTELVSRVADWLDRDDLSATQIPEAIAFAERRFNRVLRVPDMEEVSEAVLSGTTITLPQDFLQARAVHLDTDPRTTLEQLSHADLRNTYSAQATGRPAHYALQSGNEMVFGPAPDAEYAIVLNYYAKISALGDDTADNWLLLAHPDIYLLGALCELHDLMKDEARADRYEAKLKGRLAELNAQARGKAYGAAPLRIRPGVVV